MAQFEWNFQLMRRALETFPCIECGFSGGDRPVHFHKKGCSRGINLSEEVKNKRLAVWADRLQEIIRNEQTDQSKATLLCSRCRDNDSTGTIWVAYHDQGKGFHIVSQYICCDTCSIKTPHEWNRGRKWGFARGLVTFKNWELLDFLEEAGVA